MEEYTREELRGAAERVRPLLSWLSPAKADQIGPHLDALVNEPEPDREALLATLQQDAGVARWVQMDLFQRVGASAPAQEARGQALMPDGHASPVPMPRWVCPQGDFTWYQVEYGEPVPRCQRHDLELVRA